MLERARLGLDVDLPEVAASGRASVCLVGVQMALRTRGACLPAETAGLPGRPRAGNPPVPTWVAPRPPGVNLLICWECFQNPPPLPVFAQGSSLQKLKPAGRQAPPALMGSCPGLPSMGRSWRAGRSAVWSLGRAGDVASLLPSSSSPGVTPAPPPLRGTSSGSPGSTWADKLGWLESWPWRSPPRCKPVNLSSLCLTVKWG